MEAEIWDDKAWGSVLGCVGSAPGTRGGFGWAGDAGWEAADHGESLGRMLA